jgi:hypothetical protein
MLEKGWNKPLYIVTFKQHIMQGSHMQHIHSITKNVVLLTRKQGTMNPYCASSRYVWFQCFNKQKPISSYIHHQNG